MLLIYSHTSSSRLKYVCYFILTELLGIDFKFTIDSERFKNHDGAKLNYSDKRIPGNEFFIRSHSLLFEQELKEQVIHCFSWENRKAFFENKDGDFPFDILAATFYLVTRYEEYGVHEKDGYGRYHYEDSLAYKEKFLDFPLINFWVRHFANALHQRFSSLPVQTGAFRFIPTYDIDIAYSYKYKGFARNLGGFLKNPSSERLRVLAGMTPDPFDCYGWLHHIHQQYDLLPIYFFLVAEKTGPYDKNISPHHEIMWKLVAQHASSYTIGLHPSWQSGDNRILLKKEKKQLESMCATGVTSSRQHYIRFNLPEGYQRLINAGISDDYSMGYGSVNGFRASVASSFYWYDLEKEKQTGLRIHPFCFMDANSCYEQCQDPQQTLEELIHYIRVCKEVRGTLISIWHNNFLGTATGFEGWQELYEKFILQVQR